MWMRIPFLCGLVSIVCVVLGLFKLYTGQSPFPEPFNFTARALLIGAGVVLLFGINWSLCKMAYKKKE